MSLKKVLDNFASEFKTRLERGARLDKTDATGKFVKGFVVDVSDNEIVISNLTEYANAVIEGASPAKTNNKGATRLRRIERWVRAKGIKPYVKLGNGSTRFLSSTDKRYKSALYAIARGIARRGTIKRFGYKGSNLINRVYREMEDKIGIQLTEQYRKDLIGEIERIVNVNTDGVNIS